MSVRSSKILVITDFDGTVSTVDLGNQIIKKFATTDLNDIERAYAKGTIGSRAAYEQIMKRIKGSREKMLAHVLDVEKIDPYFPAFCSLSRDKGIDIKIVSDGLDFYIEAVLQKYNLAGIEYYANSAVFGADNSFSIQFPGRNDFCGRCGTCKSRILNSYRLIYDEIIYVGDSYSDFCPSRYADMVFAKKILFQRCEQEGTPCLQFDDFSEINAYLAENY